MVNIIHGPRYTVKYRSIHVLVNFIFSQAKLVIWLSRKKRIKGESSDALQIMTCLIKARIRIEFEYYKLINKIERFINLWCEGDILASVEDKKLTYRFEADAID